MLVPRAAGANGVEQKEVESFVHGERKSANGPSQASPSSCSRSGVVDLVSSGDGEDSDAFFEDDGVSELVDVRKLSSPTGVVPLASSSEANHPDYTDAAKKLSQMFSSPQGKDGAG